MEGELAAPPNILAGFAPKTGVAGASATELPEVVVVILGLLSGRSSLQPGQPGQAGASSYKKKLSGSNNFLARSTCSAEAFFSYTTSTDSESVVSDEILSPKLNEILGVAAVVEVTFPNALSDFVASDPSDCLKVKLPLTLLKLKLEAG